MGCAAGHRAFAGHVYLTYPSRWPVMTLSLNYGAYGITGSSTWDGYSREW